MGRKEDSKAAIRALNKHVEIVDESCYVARGQIEDSPENEKVIDSLRKNRLAYYLDESLGVQLHSKVRGLLDHVTSRHRFRERHGAFSGLIDDLENSIQSYKQAKSRRFNDGERFFDETREIVMELMDTLTETVNMFHHVIGDEFSVAFDIDEKIKLTTRCKDEITKLNLVFAQLSVEKMSDWVGLDLQLERLLMKALKGHVDKCLKDLAASNRKLVKMLDKLLKDKSAQKLNKLIDSFHNKYVSEPGYRPSISALSDLPICVSIADKLSLGGFADLESAKDEEHLINAALSALKKSKSSSLELRVDEQKVEITDGRGEEITEELDPLIQNVEFFFDAIFDDEYTQDLSAMAVFHNLNVESTPEDWMLMIMSYFEAQRKAVLKVAEVEEVREIIAPFDGAIYVKDILFRKVAHEAR
ncbi:hypothetical protein C8J23_10471 [Shewanella chilikensis]|uniref:DUF3375 family protein n=1 Tax=Shewanella chilikensis TaxID=558541 RepID=A0ABX5PRR8_9GAMM|nr:hypothetical protein [Shewanella chilikensis]MCL1153182.1 hypothetical protein [Shewanella chilikensis]PYE60211.1 hypothetical protein C8J23_10471 [Shewanella chilikensis]GGZ17015.1 hypothetical protein GCM10007105_00860 [Shewanella chilikensis]